MHSVYSDFCQAYSVFLAVDLIQGQSLFCDIEVKKAREFLFAIEATARTESELTGYISARPHSTRFTGKQVAQLLDIDLFKAL